MYYRKFMAKFNQPCAAFAENTIGITNELIHPAENWDFDDKNYAESEV
jgi:hypothetical protein